MRIRLGVAMAACLLAGGMLAGQSSTVQVYLVPNHGSLRLIDTGIIYSGVQGNGRPGNHIPAYCSSKRQSL